MRIRSVAVAAVLALAGCSASEPEAVSSSEPEAVSCFTGAYDVREVAVLEIESGAIPLSESDTRFLRGNWTGGVQFDSRAIFAAAQWIDLYPTCFTPEAIVAIRSMRDTLAAGQVLGFWTAERYGFLKELLLLNPAK